MLGLLGFFGALLIAIWSVIRQPRRFRFNAVVQRFEVVGVHALGIIGLMSFLVGIVIAQQGAVQLRQFGAEVFTINLVGRSAIKELGVLMTAIMVAGRSGSSFAAQIGSMKLAEEVDAMRTIGVSPMEALVLPRVLATVLMMPLLGFFAAVIAIVGGGIFCWISLDIPPVTFVQRIREVVPMTDLWQLLIKAPVFGLIIGMAGCFQGMQVEANAEEVGLRTTTAVVQGIFLVIVLDAFFAVFFTEIGWTVSTPRQKKGPRPRRPIGGARGRHQRARPSKRFGEQVVHEDLDLEVRRGEIFGVVGGSGTGKSVLMRSIIGLQRPDAGEVDVFGEPMLDRDEERAAADPQALGHLVPGRGACSRP